MSRSIRHRSALVLSSLALVASIAACASGTAGASQSGTARATYNANVITAADIESAGAQDGTVYQAIQRLRPRFLDYRGRSGSDNGAGVLLVSIDGGSLTEADALNSIPARSVAEIRYLSASDAAQKFGTSANSGPVILVRMR